MSFLIAGLILIFIGMTAAPGLTVVILVALAGWIAREALGPTDVSKLPRRVPSTSAALAPLRPTEHAGAAGPLAPIPAEQAICHTLIDLTDELIALDETTKRARQQHVPPELADQFQQRQRESLRLAQQSVERVQAATRGFERLPPPVELTETLARQNERLTRLMLAVRSARGILASIILTGFDDQRELERATTSLEALSQALGDVMATGPTGGHTYRAN